MSWIKKGLIFNTLSNYDWSKSHAQVPVVYKFSETTWRIYYATRTEKFQSVISFIDVEAGKPENILYVNNEPILNLGKLGCFDDSGVMPTSIIQIGNKLYLYYIGWTTRQSVPYHNSVGLAISSDKGFTFQRLFEGPIITTSHLEPYFTGTCYVFKENNNLFKAWYLSCTKWEIINGKPEPFYNIKYATSNDGINWNRNGLVAINYSNENEGGIVSASVIKKDNEYFMWYGYRMSKDYRTDRNASYKIGLARSLDSINWKREDENVGINLSVDGWDSEMMSYPNVIEFNNHLYMFYNGNGFGQSGFGYALWEDFL